MTYGNVYNDNQKYLTDSDENIICVNSGSDIKIRRGYGTTPNVSFSQWNSYGYDVESTVIKDSTAPVVLINPSLNDRVFSNLEGCNKFDNTRLDAVTQTLKPYHSLVLFDCVNYAPGTYKESK